MWKRAVRMGVVLAPCLAAAGASAQTGDDPPTPLERGRSEIGAAGRSILQSPRTYFSAENFTVAVGGGFTSFTQRGTDELADAGGSWTVRGAFGADQALGLEAAYLGAAYPVTALTGESGSVVSNGLEALARVGYPVRREVSYIMPYVALGLGWSLYNRSGLGDETGIEETDSVMTIPLAFGIGVGYRRLSFDLRFAYRPALADSMFDNATDSIFSTGSNTLSASGLVGYRF